MPGNISFCVQSLLIQCRDTPVHALLLRSLRIFEGHQQELCIDERNVGRYHKGGPVERLELNKVYLYDSGIEIYEFRSSQKEWAELRSIPWTRVVPVGLTDPLLAIGREVSVRGITRVLALPHTRHSL